MEYLLGGKGPKNMVNVVTLSGIIYIIVRIIKMILLLGTPKHKCIFAMCTINYEKAYTTNIAVWYASRNKKK